MNKDKNQIDTGKSFNSEPWRMLMQLNMLRLSEDWNQEVAVKLQATQDLTFSKRFRCLRHVHVRRHRLEHRARNSTLTTCAHFGCVYPKRFELDSKLIPETPKSSDKLWPTIECCERTKSERRGGILSSMS